MRLVALAQEDSADIQQQYNLPDTLSPCSSPPSSPRAPNRGAFLRALLSKLPDYAVQLLASEDDKLNTLCNLLSLDDLSVLLAQPHAEQLLDAVCIKHQQQKLAQYDSHTSWGPPYRQQQQHMFARSIDSSTSSSSSNSAALPAWCEHWLNTQPDITSCSDGYCSCCNASSNSCLRSCSEDTSYYSQYEYGPHTQQCVERTTPSNINTSSTKWPSQYSLFASAATDHAIARFDSCTDCWLNSNCHHHGDQFGPVRTAALSTAHAACNKPTTAATWNHHHINSGTSSVGTLGVIARPQACYDTATTATTGAAARAAAAPAGCEVYTTAHVDPVATKAVPSSSTDCCYGSSTMYTTDCTDSRWLIGSGWQHTTNGSSSTTYRSRNSSSGSPLWRYSSCPDGANMTSSSSGGRLERFMSSSNSKSTSGRCNNGSGFSAHHGSSRGSERPGPQKQQKRSHVAALVHKLHAHQLIALLEKRHSPTCGSKELLAKRLLLLLQQEATAAPTAAAGIKAELQDALSEQCMPSLSVQ